MFVIYTRQRCGDCALCWVHDWIERCLRLGLTVALLVRLGVRTPLMRLLSIAVVYVTQMWFMVAAYFIKLYRQEA